MYTDPKIGNTFDFSTNIHVLIGLVQALTGSKRQNALTEFRSENLNEFLLQKNTVNLSAATRLIELNHRIYKIKVLL